MNHIKLYEEFINEKWSDHRDEWDADSRTAFDKAADKFATQAQSFKITRDNITDADKLNRLKKLAGSFAPKGMSDKDFFIQVTPNAGLIPKDPSWDALARTDRKKWEEVRAEVAEDLWNGKLTESLINKDDEVNESSEQFQAIDIPKTANVVSGIERMVNTIGVNQAIRDVLGFDKVYQSSVSVNKNNIIISITQKTRK
jgi:hypothetical protein